MVGGVRSEHDKIIWWSWLQGLENAPEICKACLRSWRKCYPDYKIVILDEKNISDYISIPDYITKKFHDKKMLPAHYSDILRAQLLYTYGGIWADATVFCSARNPEYENLLTLPLFAFKEKNNTSWCAASSWFIVSDKNNPIIKLTRDLLFYHWEKCEHQIDYFLFHMLFKLAAEKYPDEWARVPVYMNDIPHKIQANMYENYSDEVMNGFKALSDFHKLTYKLNKSPSNKSIYNHIIESA